MELKDLISAMLFWKKHISCFFIDDFHFDVVLTAKRFNIDEKPPRSLKGVALISLSLI